LKLTFSLTGQFGYLIFKLSAIQKAPKERIHTLISYSNKILSSNNLLSCSFILFYQICILGGPINTVQRTLKHFRMLENNNVFSVKQCFSIFAIEQACCHLLRSDWYVHVSQICVDSAQYIMMTHTFSI